ncbi:MAG: Poly(glycerol-phosphate) alpha-glucosyltransferase [Thermoleophilia bacterium]|nr:Poly(glycerol-phosphate) alpha-glucosyltransferase [Thermoleophilia bacterium]
MTRGPIRVTTMVDSLLAGGAERVAVELACGLDRGRFEPHVLVTRGDGPLRDLLDRAGVPVTMLDRAGARDVAPWRIAHRHLAEHADVLHAHKFGSNAWGSLLARTARVPLVAHEHNFSQEPSRSRRLLDRGWIARTASRVVCVSESVADVERACGVPDRLIEVVPNGVRLDGALPRDAARAELGLTGSSFTVGIVGRLRPEKAHEVLLEAIADLARSGRDVRLCVVGDGPRRAELGLLAAKLGIANRITWAGERRDAARLASAFDAGVIASHWEGLPLAALETMAAGVPLVATQVGGLPTLLEGDAGLLVPPADPAALAAALESLLLDPSRASALARAGRRRISERYSFEGMVRRIEGIYVDVHSSGRPARRRIRPVTVSLPRIAPARKEAA